MFSQANASASSGRAGARAPSRAALSAVTLGLALALSACGSGDGGTSDEGVSSVIKPTSSVLQGRWASTGINPAYTVVVVPAANSPSTPAVDTLWALAQDTSTLYKLQANGAAQAANTVTGTAYNLGAGSSSAVAAGSYTIQGSAGAPQFTVRSVLGEQATFERSDAMAAPLRADQANGSWRATQGPVVVSWAVQSAGGANNLSGTSTSGCTYSGQSNVVANQSLYRVEFSENCAGTVQTFTGVATLSPDNGRLTVVATTATIARGLALLFARQP